jgi:hypothetical protein
MITFLDVDGWNKHHADTGESLHVYVDGVDVTKHCYRAIMHADHIHGDAWVFKVNEQGRHYFDREANDVARELLTGFMRIEAGAPLS